MYIANRNDAIGGIRFRKRQVLRSQTNKKGERDQEWNQSMMHLKRLIWLFDSAEPALYNKIITQALTRSSKEFN